MVCFDSGRDILIPLGVTIRVDVFFSALDAGMGKGLLIVVLIVGAVIAADQYYNFGHYTDCALSMLREIQRSFGF